MELTLPSAASAGMRVLRTGGCAEDAVEIAIKILEDREITNAGYGSNLPIDGHAECDAIMIDHLGRSGACGAVAREQTLRNTETRELMLCRDQEPRFTRSNHTRWLYKGAEPSPRPTKPARRSGRNRLCSRERHASLATRRTDFSWRFRTLEAMA